jgi:glycosyltransferase involved in cell wall biosynthesis
MITILLPFRNAEGTLHAAVESIVTQSFRD